MKSPILFAVPLAIVLCACSDTTTRGPDDVENSIGSNEPPVSVAEVDPDDPSILMRPFTAEEIRDEMIVGLRLMIRRSTPEGVTVELWNVVDADNDGVAIEYSVLDDDQEVIGETQTQRSTWTELRDHASFPVATSTRKWISLDTDLGTHEGWSYSVRDEAPGVVNEFFFSSRLPGAPVVMRVLQDGNEVFKMEQFVRLRPANQ